MELGHLVLLANYRHSVSVSPDASTPGCLIANRSILTQTTSSESIPQGAEVLSTSKNLIGLDNSITGIEERWAAFLELHTV
jgi:hypothetical protein